MKRLFMMLTMAMMCIASWAINGQPEGGGSETNPYKIADVQDLKWLSNRIYTVDNSSKGKFYQLVNDIDGVDFPIYGNANRSFEGTFDGCGHTIRVNIDVDKPEGYCGLFSSIVGGTVCNLTVEGSIKCSGIAVGGIAGSVKRFGKIINCINKASVTGKSNVGGIVGSLENSSIYDCVNLGTVTGTDNTSYANAIGGLVGYAYEQCNIYNSVVGYSAQVLQSHKKYNGVGGLVGVAGTVYSNASFGTKIANCVSYVTFKETEISFMTDKGTYGNLIGVYKYIDLDNCFWLKTNDPYDRNGWGEDNIAQNITTRNVGSFNGGNEFNVDDIVVAGHYCETPDEALNFYVADYNANLSYGTTLTPWALDVISEWEYAPAYFYVNMAERLEATIDFYEDGSNQLQSIRRKVGTPVRVSCKPKRSSDVFVRWQATSTDWEHPTVSIDQDGNFTMPNGTVTIDAHVAVLQKRVEPACTEPGHVQHYHCDLCNKNYSDANEQTELDDITLPALGHDDVFLGLVQATCTTPGHVAHKHCNRCGRNVLVDANETPVADVVIPATGHQLRYYPQVMTTSGNSLPECYYCLRSCGKTYTDEQATQELDAQDVYSCITGAGTEADPYIVACQGDLELISRMANMFKDPFYDKTSRQPKYVLMTNDIDVTDQINYIAYFCGVFDGGGHTLNFNITDPAKMHSYLFFYPGRYTGISAVPVIKHLNTAGTINVSGKYMFLNLVYNADRLRIEDCHNYADVTLSDNSGNPFEVCGIATGLDERCLVINCSNHGNFSTNSVGEAKVGGLLGSTSGQVYDCFNLGSVNVVSRGNTYVGGICSANIGTISNCYNMGNIHGQNPYKNNVFVAGINARSNMNSHVSNCLNGGTITACDGIFVQNIVESHPIGRQYSNNVFGYTIGNVTDEADAGCTIVGLSETTPQQYLTADGEDLIDLLNAGRPDASGLGIGRTSFFEWAYDHKGMPSFAWQSLDVNADRRQSISDITTLINVLNGKASTNRADEHADDIHTQQDLHNIEGTILSE